MDAPKSKREAYNKLYKKAREIGNTHLESIVRELYPAAEFSRNYIHLKDIFEGGEGSMWIYRTGERRGGWVDAGSVKGKRDKGDVIHLVAGKLFDGDTFEAVEYLIGAWG